MNIPTTPPVRKAIRMAARSPARMAAAAVREFARVASDMPTKPTNAEKTAPRTKKSDRPTREAVDSAGSSSSTNGITSTKPATVVNCRRR